MDEHSERLLGFLRAVAPENDVGHQREIDLAWAAGLFEGEGYIGKESTRSGLRLGITGTDEDVLRHFRLVVDAGVILGPYRAYTQRRKPGWRWSLGGDPAVELLEQMLPLLGLRRSARAREVLAWHRAQRARQLAPRTCKWCGGTYTVTMQPGFQFRKYCSRECAALSLREQRRYRKKERR